MTDLLYNGSELQMDSKLILCIEEKTNQNSIDNRLFIGWSNKDNDYYVRGRRQFKDCVPFAFRCESTDKLYDFIKFIVETNNVSIILYNYNNIDSLGVVNYDELTYEFFEEYIDKHYEITAYDNIKVKRSQIKKHLKMLRELYNWA